MRRFLLFLLAALACVPAWAQDLTPNLVGGQYHTTPPTASNGQLIGIQVDSHGVVQVSGVASAAGGASSFNLVPLGSDNHQVIKAGAGTVYGVTVFNNSGTINYIRLYDATTGFNGCNSATGLLWPGMIPASTSVGGAVIPFPAGLAFATGLSICVTSGFGFTDTTNASTTSIYLSVAYK
jgi:hypothetical protein